MKPKADDRQQVKTFRKAARELGCDPSEQRFQDALRMVAKAKPQPQSAEKRSATERPQRK
jgi:hypothetical protein